MKKIYFFVMIAVLAIAFSLTGPGEFAVDALRPLERHPAFTGRGVLDEGGIKPSRLGLA